MLSASFRSIRHFRSEKGDAEIYQEEHPYNWQQFLQHVLGMSHTLGHY